MTNLRVLYLRSVLDLYGVTKVIFQLAAELRDRGHTIVFASDNDDDFKRQLEEKGISHYTLPLKPDRKSLVSFFTCLVRIAHIVKRERIDIIHSHHRWSSFICFFVSKIFKVPLITTYHGIHSGKQFLTLWGNRVISVSEDASKHLVEYFGVDPRRIKVIQNGIKMDDFEGPEIELKKNMASHSTRPPTIANIARLSPEKDHGSLFLAMKMVLKKHPDARLLLVGKGPLEDELRGQVQDLGIAQNIEFVGEVSDIRQVLRRVDFLVLCSLTEGFPMGVLEALASAKPVVATSVGAIPKVVLDGQTGCLVPPENPEKLASAMDFMLTDMARARRMGENGRSLVQREFDIRHTALQTEKEYLNLFFARNNSLATV